MIVELSLDSNGDAGNEPAHGWAALGTADGDGIRALTINTALDPGTLTIGSTTKLYIIVRNNI